MFDFTPLCTLARKHRTDKGGGELQYGNHRTEICHNYTPVYFQLFRAMTIPVRNLQFRHVRKRS